MDFTEILLKVVKNLDFTKNLLKKLQNRAKIRLCFFLIYWPDLSLIAINLLDCRLSCKYPIKPDNPASLLWSYS